MARDQSASILFPLAGLFGILAALSVGAFPPQIAPKRSQRARIALPPRVPQLWFLFGLIFLFAIGRENTKTFAFVYLADDLNAGKDLIGLFGAIAQLAPLPALVVADWLLARFGAVFTMGFAFALHAVGWLALAVITSPFAGVVYSLMIGTGGALYIVSLVILLSRFSLPERAATDQVLAQLTLLGVAGLVAQPVGGWLYDVAGGDVLFLLDAIIMLCVIVLLALRRNRLAEDK
jgi:PPP family 3-phenylpropionic acid transporter